MTRIFHDLCLLCISDLNLRPNATMKSWKSITKIIYSSIFLLVDISSVSKNRNSITARILNRKKRFWNEQFCLILQKKHLGRKACVTVENLKYSFRNRLKAQCLEIWLVWRTQLKWDVLYVRLIYGLWSTWIYTTSV